MGNDITSAINFVIINIADLCGPIIGGFLSTHLGFKNCCLIISCILLLYCFLYFIYFYKYIFDDFQNKGRRESSFDAIIRTDENELIIHPGTFKDNSINNILSSNEDYENIIRRKNIYSGILKEKEKNEQEYFNLDDKKG